jgi:hypothetical protein
MALASWSQRCHRGLIICNLRQRDGIRHVLRHLRFCCSTAMKQRYLVTLVHGTWASNAGWTQAGSQLRKKLSERLGDDVEFKVPQWKGRNRQIDRRAGGRDLAQYLTASDDPAHRRKHFIICHSHGGNVALYATEDRRVETKVSGIICMNTPFICCVPQNFKFLYIAIGFTTTSLIIITIKILARYIYLSFAMVDQRLAMASHDPCNSHHECWCRCSLAVR